MCAKSTTGFTSTIGSSPTTPNTAPRSTAWRRYWAARPTPAPLNGLLVLGSTRLAAYQNRFGLGTTTGLGFKGESSGLVPPLLNWNGTDVASFALGQGILATPLQVLLVYNTLANGGVLVPPTLVRSAVGADGQEIALDAG